MKLITFTNDIPNGFKRSQLTTLSDIEDILEHVTRIYMSTNYPELQAGENDYEMKRASDWDSDCYYLDKHCCYSDYKFNIENIDFI